MSVYISEPLPGGGLTKKLEYTIDKKVAEAVSDIEGGAPTDYDTLKELADGKQDKLVSGTNIKTLNSASLLGSGDLTITTEGVVIVDDATTGGSLAAWSAEQGKILNDKLSELYNGLATIDNTWLGSDGSFSKNSRYKSFIFPVLPEDVIKVRRSSSQNSYLAFLSANTNFSTGGAASLCEDYSSRIIIYNSDPEKSWTMPTDARFVWVGLENYGDYAPAIFSVNGIDYLNSLFNSLLSIGRNVESGRHDIDQNTRRIHVIEQGISNYDNFTLLEVSSRIKYSTQYYGNVGTTIQSRSKSGLSAYYIENTDGVENIRIKTMAGDSPSSYIQYTDVSGTITRLDIIAGQYTQDTEYIIPVAFESGEVRCYVTFAPGTLILFNTSTEKEWKELQDAIHFCKFVEYGGISTSGRLASTSENEFYNFLKSIRNGRLIKSKNIQISCPNSFIEGYALDEEYNLVRKQTSFDTLIPNMNDAEYFNFTLRKLAELDAEHAKENGYISAQDGTENSTAGRFRLKGYFPKGTGFIAITNQNNIRIIIYLYGDDYTYIGHTLVETNTENYVVFPGNYGMNNNNGYYYRVAFSGYAASNLNQTTIDATEVYQIQEGAELNDVIARFKNGAEVCQPNITGDDSIHSLYETHPHIGSRYSETFVDAEYYTDKKYYNAYMLRLPKNYEPNGKPVRLIIWCPGTGGYNSFNKLDFDPYLEYLKYWISEGYAVASFLGNTTRYRGYYGALSDMAIETSVIAHIQGYKYLSSRYNIANDGCFVSGKSLGGLMATQLMFEKNIPVLAVAPLAPKLDAYMISTSMDNNFEGTRVYATDYQWDDGWEQYYNGENTDSAQKKAYLKSQIRKMLGTQPLLNGIIGKTPDELFEIGWSTRGSIEEPLGQCMRYCNTPVRIWCSVADLTVNFNLSKQFIKSLQNGGSPAELRAFPAPAEGDDAHHMVDNATSAPKVSEIVTANGEIFTDVPLAYVEVVQYFREHDKVTE